jgi:histone H3/H4
MGGSCKRRDCPAYAPLYLKDGARLLRQNLRSWSGGVSMVTLTAPGADLLPWDPVQCKVQREHEHAGPLGCRVERSAAAEWNAQCARNLSKLIRQARKYAKRRSRGTVTVLAYVLERQERGLFHPHVVLGYQTGPDREALDLFTAYMRRHRARYGFSRQRAGFKPGQPGRFKGDHAGRYVAKYLRPDQAKASFIPLLRDVAQLAPRTEGRRSLVRPVYVSPQLTSVTGVTMRWMRARRWMYRLHPEATPGDLDFLALLRVKFDAWPEAAGPRPKRGPPTLPVEARDFIAVARLDESIREYRSRESMELLESLPVQLPFALEAVARRPVETGWEQYGYDNRN